MFQCIESLGRAQRPGAGYAGVVQRQNRGDLILHDPAADYGRQAQHPSDFDTQPPSGPAGAAHPPTEVTLSKEG